MTALTDDAPAPPESTIDDLLRRYPHLDKQKLIESMRERGIELSEDGRVAFLIGSRFKQ